MRTWPDGFPCILREDYGLKRVNNIEASTMQSGMVRTRQVFENTPTEVNASFIATATQGRVFEMWMKAVGADWFMAPLATPQSSSVDRVNTAMHKVKLLEKWQGPELFGANRWRYTMSLIAIPVEDEYQGGDDWVDFPEYLLGASLFDRIMNKQWPVA